MRLASNVSHERLELMAAAVSHALPVANISKVLEALVSEAYPKIADFRVGH